MPIRPENKARYGKDWPAISRWIRKWRARDKCENATCGAENGKPHPITGSRVVLTVAHLNHVIEDMSDENLKALCQRCHLAHDRPMHIQGRKQRMEEARGQSRMEV